MGVFETKWGSLALTDGYKVEGSIWSENRVVVEGVQLNGPEATHRSEGRLIRFQYSYMYCSYNNNVCRLVEQIRKHTIALAKAAPRANASRAKK